MARRDCPECDGTGWKPVETDGVRRVVRCECHEGERAARLLDQARIPRRYEHCALENFDIRKDPSTGQANPSLAAARLVAERFVEEYPTDFGLLFLGPTGVGKTHLAVAVLRELVLRKSVECLFYDFRDLLKEIQDSYNPVSQTSELRVLQPVLDVEVLALDELAALNPSDWVKETLAHIINSRYNQKKVTMITTTLPFAETTTRSGARTPSGDEVPNVERSLGQLGVTLRSRLYEMCKLVEMHSDDYRKAIKQAGYRFHAE
ncbi:MAG: ATP-binding protein [Acidobacteria bacterium]|nr:ATP-binding protein [Acidobacteriota bacterium]